MSYKYNPYHAGVMERIGKCYPESDDDRRSSTVSYNNTYYDYKENYTNGYGGTTYVNGQHQFIGGYSASEHCNFQSGVVQSPILGQLQCCSSMS